MKRKVNDTRITIDGGPGAWYAEDQAGRVIERGWDERARLLVYLVHIRGYSAEQVKYAE